MTDTLEARLRAGAFTITAGLVPPFAEDEERLLLKVAPLRGRVDAVAVAGAATGETASKSFAVAAVLAANGYEPVLQVSCRERNRVALEGDLLGAAGLGVRNLLIVHTDDPLGAQADARAVFDLRARELMTIARDMRSTGQLPSGRRIEPRPRFFIGSADVLPSGLNWSMTRLLGKVDAGVDFVETQPCFDLETVRHYMRRLGDEGITERLSVIIGVSVLRDAKSARGLNEKQGIVVPADVIGRLESANSPAEEGRRICAEFVQGLREVAGVSGAHLIAPEGGIEAIAAVLDSLPMELRKANGSNVGGRE